VRGGGVDEWLGGLEGRWGAGWTWGFEAFDTRKGATPLGQAWQPGTPVPGRTLTYPVDQDVRAALTADWSPSPSWTVSVAAGEAHGTSRGHVVGDDQSGAYGSARATLRW